MGQANSSDARSVHLDRPAVMPSGISGGNPPVVSADTPSSGHGQLASKAAEAPKGIDGRQNINGLIHEYHHPPCAPQNIAVAESKDKFSGQSGTNGANVNDQHDYHNPPKKHNHHDLDSNAAAGSQDSLRQSGTNNGTSVGEGHDYHNPPHAAALAMAAANAAAVYRGHGYLLPSAAPRRKAATSLLAAAAAAALYMGSMNHGPHDLKNKTVPKAVPESEDIAGHGMNPTNNS